MEDEIFGMTTKTEISKVIINLMGRLSPVSSNSVTMKNNDCMIKTNEMYHQDMYSGNEDIHKNQL